MDYVVANDGCADDHVLIRASNKAVVAESEHSFMGVAENPDRINHHVRSHAFLLTQIVPTVLLGNATTFTFYHCFVIGNVQNVFGLNIYLVIMAIRKANNGL